MDPTIALNILYIKLTNVQFIFQKLIAIVKTNSSLNDPKQRKRRLALSCSKKTIRITKRNFFKT